MLGLKFNHPNSVFYDKYRRQLKASLTVNIIAFSHGIALGWVAPILFKLQSFESPLMFRISVEEASWIGALLCIGGMIGNTFYGNMLDRVGRKMCLYLLAVPHICHWIMVYFSSNVYHLYIARIFGGMTGGGVFIVIPLYISEIADCKIRGTLGSFFCLLINVGVLTGLIIASHVPYLIVPCGVLLLPALYLLIWMRFPETPQHLLRKGLTAKAEESYKFYKNYKGSIKEDEQAFAADFDELKKCIQTAKNGQDVTFLDFCTKRSLKAVSSGVILVFVNMFSGMFAIISYGSMIFAETGSTIDPNTNTIIIGAVQIIGSYCGTVLVDIYGRKILLLVSTCGMCLGMTTIGVYSYLLHDNNIPSVSWLPVVIISFVIFAANIGVIAVTFVVLVEILPPKIRSLGSTFCLFLYSVFAFALLKIFPILMAIIGLSGVLWMCAGVAGFGFLFVLLCLRETKGKSLDNDSAYD